MMVVGLAWVVSFHIWGLGADPLFGAWDADNGNGINGGISLLPH